MLVRSLLISLLFSCVCFGQALPDRDELVKKFLNESTSSDAAKDLITHFQMGGLRTILRNIDQLPLETRLQYGEVLRHMDLIRFRNDLNGQMEGAGDAETRAMYLMLLSTIGRTLDKSIFEKYIDDETQDLRVRLAAAAGPCKIQNPAAFDRLYEVAEKAEIDPATGRNDFRFCDISKANLPFYFYTKGIVGNKKKVSHGAVLSAIAIAEADSVEIYEHILDMRQKKYIEAMIDRAIQVGGVELLNTMADHKFTKKKFKDEIAAAIAPARKLAEYRAKYMDKVDKETTPIGPLVPTFGSGTGRDGFRSAYAVVKVSETGDMSIMTFEKPYGGTDNLKQILTGTTLPAWQNWKPVESYALVLCP
jgi:hypothetical protein